MGLILCTNYTLIPKSNDINFTVYDTDDGAIDVVNRTELENILLRGVKFDNVRMNISRRSIRVDDFYIDDKLFEFKEAGVFLYHDYRGGTESGKSLRKTMLYIGVRNILFEIPIRRYWHFVPMKGFFNGVYIEAIGLHHNKITLNVSSETTGNTLRICGEDIKGIECNNVLTSKSMMALIMRRSCIR